MNSYQINLLQSKLLNQLRKDNPSSSPSVECYLSKVTILNGAVIPKEMDLILNAVKVSIIEQNAHNMDFSCLLELTNEIGFCVNLKTHSTSLPDLSNTSIRGLTLSALSGKIVIQGNYSTDKYLTRLAIHNAIGDPLKELPALSLINYLTLDSEQACNVDFSRLIGFKNLFQLSLSGKLNGNDEYRMSFSNISLFHRQLDKVHFINNVASPKDICCMVPLTKEIEISQTDVDFKDFGDIFQKDIIWKFSTCDFKNEYMVLNFKNILVHQGTYMNKKWVTLKQFIAEGSCQEKIGDTYHFGPSKPLPQRKSDACQRIQRHVK